MARAKRAASGYFETTITVGRDDNGKRIRKRIRSKTLQGLRDKQEAALAAKENKTLSVGHKPRLSEYLPDWLERVVKVTNDRSTYTRYEQDVRNHLTPILGRHRLDKLEVRHGQDMVARLLKPLPKKKPDEPDKFRAPRTVRNIVATLRVALEQARTEGLVKVNVAVDIKLPAMPPPALETVTADDARRLLVAVRGHRLEALFWTLLLLGLREGEALALMWDDVDLERATVRVAHTFAKLRAELSE